MHMRRTRILQELPQSHMRELAYGKPPDTGGMEQDQTKGRTGRDAGREADRDGERSGQGRGERSDCPGSPLPRTGLRRSFFQRMGKGKKGHVGLGQLIARGRKGKGAERKGPEPLRYRKECL